VHARIAGQSTDIDQSRSEGMLEQHGFAACLFDMDGTLTNSVAAAERVWSQWAEGKEMEVGERNHG